MMLKFFVYLVLSVLLLGCSKEPTSVVPMVTFDLSVAKQMKMSEFVDSITLIPLETNESSLIKSVQTLDITDETIYVEERGNFIAFDKNGSFLYSTRHLQGLGPEDYYSALDFTALPNGNLEVFDAVKFKLITYNKDLQFVSSHKLPKEILPVAWCWYVSENYRLLVERNGLKLYSIKDNKIEKSIRMRGIPHFGFYGRNSLCVENDAFYVSTFGQTGYHQLLLDGLDLKLKQILEFDFGEDYNFNALNLPEGETERFYLEYKKNNPRKVFVSGKYVDGSKQMCFFIHDNKSCFAYEDEERGFSRVYYNMPMTKKQFLPANLYRDDVFYYACEPQTLEYVIDESLMSSDDIEKMKSIREDDNPIIVCYKLK